MMSPLKLVSLVLSVLYLVFTVSGSAIITQDIRDLSPNELIKIGQDTADLLPYQLQTDDVKFYLRNKEISEPLLLNSDNIDLIDGLKKSKILIHGWIENHKRSWYEGIAKEYLKRGDFNIIEVEYERIARLPYIKSAECAKYVGKEVAQFVEKAKLSPTDLHIIGHSLGSHVAGFAAKQLTTDTDETVARITGLDPAGPYFRQFVADPSSRLDKHDAMIVDIIHTDGGFFGYEEALGTLDIYVNGGERFQPGCVEQFFDPTSLGDIVEKSFCSHARSTKYFIDSINNGKFSCRFCQSLFGLPFYADRCILHHTDRLFGAEDINEDITGVCFAESNSDIPYFN